MFDESLFEDAKLPLPEMGEYLKKVDDGMKRIAKWDRRDDIPETELDRALENDLGKKALRALYMAGMFGDLPDAGQVHPGMQARVERALPEMDEAVSEMAEYLSSLSDEQVEHAQQFLKGKDNPAMAIAQRFDDVETALGVSHRRRLQTRAFVTQVVSRLKNQPPRSVFDDYIGRVERLAARSGSVEKIERQMIARMGKDAFFERQRRLAMYAAAWEDEGVTADDFEFEDLPPVIIPDPDEVDAGVFATAAPQPAVDPFLAHCKELESKWQVLVDDHSHKRISTVEYRVRSKRLKAQMGGCQITRPDPSPVPAPQQLNLSRDECQRILEDMEREIRRANAEYRKRTITRLEAKQWAKKHRERSDVRHCVKKKKRNVGLGCLGIGAVLSVTALVMIFFAGGEAAIAGAFIATPGAILLLIGLFMLLAVATKYPDV
jgi:hypothetical protein